MTQSTLHNGIYYRMNLKPLYTLASAMMMISSLSACDEQTLELPSETNKPALTVEVTSPTTQLISGTVTANGNVGAWQEAIIGPEINGLRVEELLVQEGDWVQKGQPLAKFAQETTENNLLLAESALVEAKAEAADARANGVRARKLRQSGALSEQNIQELLSKEQIAQARLSSAKVRVADQKHKLSQTILRAPDDGIISTRTATVGAVPTQGDEMFRMILKGRLEWRAELSTIQLEQIKTGQMAKINTSNGTWAGVVRLAAPTVNPNSRRGIAYIDIHATDIKTDFPLRPGAYVNGTIFVGDKQGMMLPQSAVVARDGFHFVFVVDDKMQVNQHKVTVGRIHGDNQEILSGLEGNERIVASGGAFLNNGDRVQLAAIPIPLDQR